ncbi:MAG TPA: nucleoside-diphosphate sugar epimerase/dehydratase [Flavobacterium sp.]|uniref:nucleoside-diphosphate sugar epimerase/dehydratase n=1 Tax=Flavobacterium sp. TaxID=239 RepID=UPI002DBC451B|nr:nucleoside-diphosphate sugar epimerase/dehydratase [Flavobacterium sp.]HEU4788931.1 nucleoside-diphosphate sugar epimerase/dehydratase [Flavobacterium sp.]
MFTIFFFWLLQTYAGIIRHSTFIDELKLFMSQFGTFLIMFLLNTGFEFWQGEKLFLNAQLYVCVLLSFYSLILYRIVIKMVFKHYFLEKQKKTLIPAFIYGANSNAVAVANALNSESPLRFRLLGFVDKNNHNKSNRVMGLPVFDNLCTVAMQSKGSEILIIADNVLTEEAISTIMDDCLQYNFKVYSVPSILNWENQNEVFQKVKNFQIMDLLGGNSITLDNNAISSQLKGKTVLITGAAGSIGREIVRQVLAFAPEKIIMVDQAETPLYHLILDLEKVVTSSKIHGVIADVRNYKRMESLFKLYQPNVVYHAAAYNHIVLLEENPAQAVFTNVVGTRNVADLALCHQVDLFVMISIDNAKNPINVMEVSKRIAEKYVQSLFYKSQNGVNKGTKFITTRFGKMLVTNGSIVSLFSEQIASGGPITITHPEVIRYFMTIPEACQLILEAGAMGNGGEIFVFDMGKPCKIVDLARKMIKLAGFIPDEEIKIQVINSRPEEKLYEEFLNNTSETFPTRHNKIMMAHEIREDFETLHNDIEELIDAANLFDNDTIVLKMEKIVPEFKRIHSTFEILDH